MMVRSRIQRRCVIYSVAIISRLERHNHQAHQPLAIGSENTRHRPFRNIVLDLAKGASNNALECLTMPNGPRSQPSRTKQQSSQTEQTPKPIQARPSDFTAGRGKPVTDLIADTSCWTPDQNYASKPAQNQGTVA